MLARLLGGLLRVFSKEKTGYTRRNFWGHSVHYNKDGEKVGWSRKNFWGGRNRYNKNDELTSYTMKNFWGGYNTYDPDGNLIKKSYKNVWGGHNTYDLDGNLEKQTVRNIWKGDDIYEGEPKENIKHSKTKTVREQTVRRNDNTDFRGNVTVNSSDNNITGKYISPTPLDKKYVVTPAAVPDASVLMPNHKIDRNISYFDSVDEAVLHYGVPGEYVKILAFSWNNHKEVPALAYLINDVIRIVPLIKNVEVVSFLKEEVNRIRKEVKENVTFEEMENSFLELGISKLGEDYEALFPEYCFNRLDGLIDVYHLPCGITITEKSVDNLKGLFDSE